MRGSLRPFINFSDFHVPFSKADLFHLDLTESIPDMFYHSFGEFGAGMQSAMELRPEEIVNHSTVADEDDKATYRIQTMILPNKKPIDMKAIRRIFEESRRTGKTMASLSREVLNTESVKVVISPARTVPEIAHRKGRGKK